MFTKLVRERGKVYAVKEWGVPTASDMEGNTIKGLLRFTDKGSEVIVTKGTSSITVIHKPSYDVVKGLSKKFIGKLLVNAYWMGDKLPFYDMESGKLLLIDPEDKETEDLGEIPGYLIPIHSNRCGGLERIRFFLTDGFTTKLYEIDTEGNMRMLDYWKMKVRDVTRSGTGYDCSSNEECSFVDCELNFIKVENSIVLFSNALIVNEQWVAFEILRSDSKTSTRILMMNEEGIFDYIMPYTNIRDPFLVDAHKGLYLIHGEKKGKVGAFLFKVGLKEELVRIDDDTLLPEEIIISPQNNSLAILVNGRLKLIRLENPLAF